MNSVKNIVIIGAGFMGGSLVLALRDKLPKINVSVYARSKASYDKILNTLKKGVSCDLKKTVSCADIVFLATPIYSITDYLGKIAPYLKNGSIVCDLGSTKAVIERKAKSVLPKGVSFVGAHPLCGGENSGIEYSKKDLYKGSFCIVTAKPGLNSSKIIKNIWTNIGASVFFLDSLSHDKVLSSVSHLPHMISFALTNSVDKEKTLLSLGSWRSITRISNSPAPVWTDIFLSNQKNIIKDTDKFIKQLTKLRDYLKRADRKNIEKFIKGANFLHSGEDKK